MSCTISHSFFQVLSVKNEEIHVTTIRVAIVFMVIRKKKVIGKVVLMLEDPLVMVRYWILHIWTGERMRLKVKWCPQDLATGRYKYNLMYII